jgi:hypothetical protein
VPLQDASNRFVLLLASSLYAQFCKQPTTLID